MPIKFSELPTNAVASISKLVGLSTTNKNVLLNVNDLARESDVVHKSGNETIGGLKTFTYKQIHQDVTFDASGSGLVIRESSDHNTQGKWFLYRGSNGDITNRWQTSAYGVNCYVDERISENGGRVFQFNNFDAIVGVTPTEDTTSSRQIDTVGARNTKLQGYASLSANNTFTGNTTFSSNAVFSNGLQITGSTDVPTPSSSSNDGSVANTKWVRDLLTTTLSTMYPVGSIYISTTATCPLASLFGTWSKVGAGRTLWGADSSHAVNTTIEAGLPNITAKADVAQGSSRSYNAEGAFYQTNDGNGGNWDTPASCRLRFDASRSSSIYGNSTTVQPPAYVVNIFRRTA